MTLEAAPSGDSSTPSGEGEPPVDLTPPAADGQGTPPETPPAGDAPEIPEAYRGQDGAADLSKLLERANAADQSDATRSENTGEVPDSADGYSLALDEAIELPGGGNVEFDAADPMMKEFLADAHAKGMGQKEVSGYLKMYGTAVASNMKSMSEASQAAVDAAIATLGDDGGARITGATAAMAEIVGQDGADALINDIRSAEGFKTLEALLTKTNGTPGGRAPGGDVPDTRTTAEKLYPEYSKGT